MKALTSNIDMLSKYTDLTNNIIVHDGCGSIDGVEFDLRHEKLDYDQWSIINILNCCLYLPSEYDDGVIYNRQALWFPWFGTFSADTLRSRLLKLKGKRLNEILKGIEEHQGTQSTGLSPMERLIVSSTPKYILESGDKITISKIAEATIGADHLHEHDRIIKNAYIIITKHNGEVIDVKEPFTLIGHHNIVNPYDEFHDAFGSVLFRIVEYHGLKQPSQLRTIRRSSSDVSIASSLAYNLYKLVEPAWPASDDKIPGDPEEIELVDRIQHLMPASDGGDDFIGVGGPGEGRGLPIVLFEESIDGRLQIDDRSEYAALESALSERGEEAFDGVEP